MRNNEIQLSDIPLPDSEMIERQVIADAVSSPELIGEVSALITDADFTSDDRKYLWTTLVKMYNNREAIDIPSVWQVTGAVFINEIQARGVNGTTATAFLEHARLLHIAATKKRAYYAALTIVQQAASPQSSEEDIFGAADALSRKIQGESGRVGETILSSVLAEVADETERMEQDVLAGKVVKVPTGIPALDHLFYGGFDKGQLIVVAARPSVGKTAFTLQLAKNAGVNGVPSLYFSLEMTKGELGRRFLFSTGCLSQDQIALGKVDWVSFERARGTINNLPVYVNDTARTLQGIEARMTRAVGAGECRIAFIDYLGLMKFDSNSRAPLYQQIGDVTRELKAMAKRLQIPIVIVVQLNRKSVEDGRPPELHDLRDSGDIEQDADIVMMLMQRYPEGATPQAGDLPYVDVWVRKNRNYKKDVKVTLVPNKSYTSFLQRESPEWMRPPMESVPDYGIDEPF